MEAVSDTLQGKNHVGMDKIGAILACKFLQRKIRGNLRIGRIRVAPCYASACEAKTGFDHIVRPLYPYRRSKPPSASA